MQIVLPAQPHLLFAGEAGCTHPDQENVFALFHDATGEGDRVAHILDGGDAAGTEGIAVHDAGVQFHFPGGIDERPASGVEGLVVFHHDDRTLRRHRPRSHPACRTFQPAAMAAFMPVRCGSTRSGGISHAPP